MSPRFFFLCESRLVYGYNYERQWCRPNSLKSYAMRKDFFGWFGHDGDDSDD